MERIIKHYDKGERIYPIYIDIGLTKFCNAKCAYCYGERQVKTGDMIERKALIKLLIECPQIGIKSMSFTGYGEPTLNPAMYDAMTAGARGGLDIGVATNGIAIDDEKIKVMLENSVWIRFNLSAVNREVYYKIHGVDKWDVVKRNIERTTEIKKSLGLNTTIGLQMVLIPDALGQVIPEAVFAKQIEADYFVIKQYSNPEDCPEMSQFDLNWYDNQEVLGILREAESMSDNFTSIVPKYNMIKTKGKRPYDRCVDVPLIFQISGNGKCYPCGYLFNDDRYLYGDIHQQSIKEILDSERYWTIVEKLKNDFNVHTECVGCCRHDSTNKFMWEYLHPPSHINFI